jgi:hypothetical protein
LGRDYKNKNKKNSDKSLEKITSKVLLKIKKVGNEVLYDNRIDNQVEENKKGGDNFKMEDIMETEEENIKKRWNMYINKRIDELVFQIY